MFRQGIRAISFYFQRAKKALRSTQGYRKSTFLRHDSLIVNRFPVQDDAPVNSVKRKRKRERVRKTRVVRVFGVVVWIWLPER